MATHLFKYQPMFEKGKDTTEYYHVSYTHLVTPVQTKDFKWDLEATFAKNTQKVYELAEGLDEYSLTSGLSGLQIKAEVGCSFGLYGTGCKCDDSGNYVINEKTGLREIVNNVRCRLYTSRMPIFLLCMN